MGRQLQIATRATLATNRQGKYAEFHTALVESDGATDEEIKTISNKLGLNFAKL
jgi:hypothetical protein